MKKEEALKIILACADKFQKNLVNKNLLFICADKNRNISTMEVAFVKGNYLHIVVLVQCFILINWLEMLKGVLDFCWMKKKDFIYLILF